MVRLAIALALLIGLAPSAGAAQNADGVAVLIGNQSYRNRDIPAVDFAHRDAEAFKRYVVDVLGFPETNLIDLRDATKGQIESVFGNRQNHRGKAFQYVKPGKSDLVVYYSGHGVPGVSDRRGYLLPSDADPATVEINGYPIDLLYDNLAKIGARSVTVYVDACFSGNSPKGMLIKSASPVLIKAKSAAVPTGMSVLTAASGDQLASWDTGARLGLFTNHLLDALYGKADSSGTGNKDGKVTLNEVEAYLAGTMTPAARRQFNREQTASISGKGDKVLTALPEGRVQPRTRPRATKSTAVPSSPGKAQDASDHLSVSVWTRKQVYRIGENFRIFLKGNKDFLAVVVYGDAAGSLIQLLPNRYRTDNRFRGGPPGGCGGWER
jgi:uncharacterized caspase-like protein